MSANPSAVAGLDGVRVSFRVRSVMPMERVDAYEQVLRACETAGHIDGYKLQGWPPEVAVAPGGPERALIRGYDSYREWADRAGVRLEPAFTTRTRSSIVTGDEIEVLVLPALCLALYDDAGALVGVYPHTDAEGTYTVADALTRLRTGTIPGPRSGALVRVDGDETCPDCHSLLGYERGLSVCPDCAWLGSLDADGTYVRIPIPEPEGTVADAGAPGTAGRDSDDVRVVDPRQAPTGRTGPERAVRFTTASPIGAASAGERKLDSKRATESEEDTDDVRRPRP